MRKVGAGSLGVWVETLERLAGVGQPTLFAVLGFKAWVKTSCRQEAPPPPPTHTQQGFGPGFVNQCELPLYLNCK